MAEHNNRVSQEKGRGELHGSIRKRAGESYWTQGNCRRSLKEAVDGSWGKAEEQQRVLLGDLPKPKS